MKGLIGCWPRAAQRLEYTGTIHRDLDEVVVRGVRDSVSIHEFDNDEGEVAAVTSNH